MTKGDATDHREHKNSIQNSRAPRFESHALIDVRLSLWNPFVKRSAVLLDLSLSGFKIEFVSQTKLIPGKLVLVTIPLLPFGVESSSSLKIKVIIRWFDPESLRCGGVFHEVSSAQLFLIEQVVAKISSQR